MGPDSTMIAIPEHVIAEVDDHLHLYGSFLSRRELIAFAILHFLDRVEEFGAYSS